MRETFSVATLPSPLDVVWCRFPEDEMPKKPGPKPRPGLVRSVRLSKDHTWGAVEVTYGTSKRNPFDHPLELHIANSSDLDKIGLPQATCFVLARTVLLPWGPDFFCKREDGTGPVIGHLTPTALMQLESLKVLRRQAGV